VPAPAGQLVRIGILAVIGQPTAKGLARPGTGDPLIDASRRPMQKIFGNGALLIQGEDGNIHAGSAATRLQPHICNRMAYHRTLERTLIKLVRGFRPISQLTRFVG
jgi:hypothetical protein